MLNTLIIDEDKLFRISFKSLLERHHEINIVADVSNDRELRNDFNNDSVDLIIIDPVHLNQDQFENLQRRFQVSRILVLTHKTPKLYVLNLLNTGILGYFSKRDCPIKLQRVIKEIAINPFEDEVRLGPIARQTLLEERNIKNNVRFSTRELEVLRLVCEEKTNAEIASILGLSERTIESHRRRMIDRTESRTMIGVLINAFQFDLRLLQGELI